MKKKIRMLVCCLMLAFVAVSCAGGDDAQGQQTKQQEEQQTKQQEEQQTEQQTKQQTEKQEEQQDAQAASGEVYIYLVRHGETMFNRREIMQGWCDSPLTEEGIEMAQALGRGLSDVDFAAAYSSVSERAMDTANYILEGRGMELQLSENLKEINFGECEAIPNEEAWSDRSRYSQGFVDVGGESPAMVRERMMQELETIAEENASTGGNVLVVSHGMAIQYVLSAIDQEAFSKFTREGGSMENCCVSVIQWKDGEFSLLEICSTQYRDSGME